MVEFIYEHPNDPLGKSQQKKSNDAITDQLRANMSLNAEGAL